MHVKEDEDMFSVAYRSALFVMIFMITACVAIPDGIKPVTDFDIDRYLGTWYEIARLDHKFERNLTHVTAEYHLLDRQGLRVINEGYNSEDDRWERAVGKAYFIDEPDVGRLKVSFFGPFYSAYNIIALDKEDYNYAMVTGPDRSYLWILARTPDLDRDIITKLVKKAESLGFKTEELIFVDHQRPVASM
jgi:apolipoprotein D and lipocalin family protein